VTLPAFDAKRQLLQYDACSDRSVSPARRALSKPAAVAAVDRWDRQTDGRTLDRYVTLRRILCGQHQSATQNRYKHKKRNLSFLLRVIM